MSNHSINNQLFDPVKMSNPFAKGLLSDNLFQTKIPIKIKSEPHKIIQKTKTATIEVNIESISDLLNIVEQTEYSEDTEYNVDLKALINIKEELTQLNSMIGLKH